MFFIDKPYVSELLKKSVQEHKIPVVRTPILEELKLYDNTCFLEKDEAIKKLMSNDVAPYSNSENAIEWINKYAPDSKVVKNINIFKDKLNFRELSKDIFPNFFFQGVDLKELINLDFNSLPKPFILKPRIGFFSLGVYKIENIKEWKETINSINDEIERIKKFYPKAVLDTTSFIIEELIEGDEFAVDLYYNNKGEAVIMGILQHFFASKDDVSDRIYITSKQIIESNFKEFQEIGEKIGEACKIKNFPVHMELRRREDGSIVPIEINAMRFGGWCTSPDLNFVSFGYNSYLYYYNQQKPDWDKILKNKDDSLYSFIILDNSTGEKAEDIISFDHEKVKSLFHNILEYRVIDYKVHNIFAVLFSQTPLNKKEELDNILKSDLREFIKIK